MQTMSGIASLGRAWIVVLGALLVAGCGPEKTRTTAPVFQTEPQDITVALGQPAIFTATTQSVGPISIQWRRNGTAIPGATTFSYTTPATTVADNGALFDVVVSSSAGSVTSRQARLTVAAPPTITTQPPASVTVASGGTAQVSVVVAGTPAPTLQWRLGATNLANGAQAAGACAGSTVSGATTATLSIAAVPAGCNGAVLSVVVTNAGGSVTSTNTTIVVTATTTVTPAVAAGGEFNFYTVALRGDGSVWAWGDNTNGALGDGTTASRATPARVTGLPTITQIAAGGGHVLALGSDGSVWAWGRNAFGQVGNGSGTDQRSPVRVVTSGAVAIAAGTVHSLAALNTGGVLAWGSNFEGQVGSAPGAPTNVPQPVVGLTGAVEVAGGIFHSIARTATGQVFVWGTSPNGQLGLGSASPTPRSPTQITALSNIIAIGAGSQTGAALAQGGTIFTWGLGTNGQLGNGGNTNTAVPGAIGGTFTGLSRGNANQHLLAITAAGGVQGWGFNGQGQLGIGNTTSPILIPTTVAGAANVTSVSASFGHSAIATSAGAVLTWGQNGAGQLGRPASGTPELTPAAVPGFNLIN